MTHPSVNSIVERLRTVRTGDPVLIGTIIDDLCDEAATIISDLQAERYTLIADLADMKARALTAESSLSRIKEETIEKDQIIRDLLKAIDMEESNCSQGLFLGTRRVIASAIRSLGSTGGAEKTAESGNPAPTRERE